MTLKTVPVTGTLYNADGSVAANAAVTANLTVVDYENVSGVDVIAPSSVSAVTDAGGNFTLNLWPNSRGINGSDYLVRAQMPGALSGVLIFSAIIHVPDSDPAVSIPIGTITTRTKASALSDAKAAMLAAQAFTQQALGAQSAVAYIYPGVYATAPTKRPDGSAIQAGDRYNNSTDGYGYVFINGAWDSQAKDAASSAAAAQNAQTQAQAAANTATNQANAATAASAVVGSYPNAYATALPQGVTAINITNGGSGGTNGTGYAGGVSGGPTGFAWTYDIVGGVATNAKITNAGLSTSNTAPTLSFPNGALGGTPAATATVGPLVANQKDYLVASADGASLDWYKNSNGSPTRDTSMPSLPTTGVTAGLMTTASGLSQFRLKALNEGNRQRLYNSISMFGKTLAAQLAYVGDSIMRGFGASDPTTRSSPVISERGLSPQGFANLGADGTRSDAILTSFNGLTAAQKSGYGVADGGYNDTAQNCSGVPALAITAAGTGGTQGTYAVGWTGGVAGSNPVTPQWNFTVDNTGKVSSVTMVLAGGGWTTVPTPNTSACPGLTGATLTPTFDITRTIVANLGAILSGGSNWAVVTPWSNTLLTAGRRAFHLLKQTYGARVLEGLSLLTRYHSDSATDVATALNGGLPPSITSSSPHPNDAGYQILGDEYDLIMRAMSGIGAPYIHDEIVTAPITTGASVVTLRTIGSGNSSPTRYAIVDGNEAGAFDINPSTGAITRSSSSTMPNVTELFVQAESYNGPSNVARVVVGRTEVSTQPSRAVRVNTSAVIAGEYLANATTTKKVSIVLCARANAAPTDPNPYLLRAFKHSGNRAAYVQMNGTQFRPLAKDDGGSLILLGSFAPLPANTGAFNFYFFCMDSTSGVQTAKSITNEAYGGVQSASITTADYLFDLTEYVNVFEKIPGNDFKMLWIGQDWIDFTVAGNRALFYDPVTLLPKDLGAGGVVSGITPLIYFQGYAGDYMTGNNRGNGGQMFAAPYLNAANPNYSDLSA